MRKLMIMLALVFAVSANAQVKGDWYVGTGDIANVAWTEWAVSPTVGYGLMDNLMVGLSISQADSLADVSYDLHARYFYKGYFAYAATQGLDTDGMKIGVGKMFTIQKGIYIDPKIVYNTEAKTTNLTLGFGFTF